MGAPLCHFELMSDDPDKCKAFYAGVFGWEYDDKSMPGYTLIKPGEEPDGGLMKRPAEVPQVALNVYFLVDDVEGTLAKVTAAAAEARDPPDEPAAEAPATAALAPPAVTVPAETAAAAWA